VGFRRRLPGELRLKNSTHPLFDFGFPPESSTTSPSPPNRVAIATNSSHGLSIPSAHPGNEGPLAAGLASPATFRLQGLVTLMAGCSPRSLSGFVSPRQRSWDSPFEAPSREVADAFGRPQNLLAVSPARSPATANSYEPVHWTPTSRLWPSRESRTARYGLGSGTTWKLPWGFPLPGQSTERLEQVSPRSPLTRFTECSSANCSTDAP